MGGSRSIPPEVYHSIIRTAEHIAKLTSSASLPSSSFPTTPFIPALHLRSTPDLTVYLAQEELSKEALKRLSASFEKFTGKLQQQFVAQFQQTCTTLAKLLRHDDLPPLSKLFDQLNSSFASLYEQKIEMWIVEVRKMVKNRARRHVLPRNRVLSKDEPITTEGGDNHFNTSYVPILETYFEKQQFPSRVDKEFLALKSGMTYKQIHIWFQNRRSRTKKANSVSSKEHTLVDSHPDMAGLQHCKSLTKAVNLAEPLSARCSAADEAFPHDSPSYAFPVVYPPSISENQDPFPCRFGDFTTIPKPSWYRRPSATSQDHQHPGDLDSLTFSFSCLKIDDTVQRASQTRRRRTSQTPQGCLKSSRNITSPCTVRPLRAPLASLVRDFVTVGHRCSNVVDNALVSQDKVGSMSRGNSGAQISSRKSRQRQESQENASLASGPTSSSDSALKGKKPTKKAPSRRTPCSSNSRRNKRQRAPPIQAVEQLPQSPTFHPSPTASVDSLPSLSYSSEGSCASTCSQSPTTSFALLPNDDHLVSFDEYDSQTSSLTMPSPQPPTGGFPLPTFASNDFSFQFSKGPLDDPFNLDLPSYPSYSESFDWISQGLQSSPDFAPPSLTFDLPSFKS